METLARRGYRSPRPGRARAAGVHHPHRIRTPRVWPGLTRRTKRPTNRPRDDGYAYGRASSRWASIAALDRTGPARPISAGTRRAGGASPTLVVLPFQNLGGSPDDEYLADGLTETLTTDLARVPGLVVIARNSAFQYKGKARGRARAWARSWAWGTSSKAASAALRSDSVRVNAQLIDAGSGYHVWSEKYDRPAGDVFKMQDEIGRAVRRALRIQLNTASADLGPAPHTTPEAYDAYLRGLYRLYHAYPRVAGPPELEEAIRWLERAVALDSHFALGHAMLARAYARKFFFKDSSPQWQEKAFLEAEKALALDPTLAEAYVARGDLVWTRASRFPHEAAMTEVSAARWT